MYAILATRSSNSMFGFSSGLAKDKGEVMTFQTEAEAQAKVDEWMRALRTTNVKYEVVEQ